MKRIDEDAFAVEDDDPAVGSVRLDVSRFQNVMFLVGKPDLVDVDGVDGVTLETAESPLASGDDLPGDGVVASMMWIANPLRRVASGNVDGKVVDAIGPRHGVGLLILYGFSIEWTKSRREY